MNEDPRGLLVLPLGGCGEVGLNSTLFCLGSDAILVDCGAQFGLDEAPGVDRVIPGFGPLFAAGRRLLAVLLTHGHEDHIGAVAELLDRVPLLPVWGPPLALRLLRSRMETRPHRAQHFHGTRFGERHAIGPFEVEWIRVTHSLPESAAIAIRTDAGLVLHSGDFKLDPDPIDGLATDTQRLSELGESGVDLLLSDSTNAERRGHTRPEREVGQELTRIVRETEGRVFVSCFASHLHRLQGIASAAQNNGRRIALVGSALERTWRIGVDSGHLNTHSSLLFDPLKIPQLPRREVLVLVTGTQGEFRAGLSRLARAADSYLTIDPGDRVVLSATTIPGNERPVRRALNALTARGAKVIHDRMCPVHCSGHAHQEEQAELIKMVRPRHFLPVHGDRIMLEAHAALARAQGIPADRVHVLHDGQSLLLRKGALVAGPDEPAAPVALDLFTRRGIPWPEVNARRRASERGILFCSMWPGPKGVEVALSTLGLALVDVDRSALLAAAKAAYASEDRAQGTDRAFEAVERALGRVVRERLNARPVIEVHDLAGRTFSSNPVDDFTKTIE